MQCYDEGQLRAYLDDALPTAKRADVTVHLTNCAVCRAALDQQRTVAAQLGLLLAAPAESPDPRIALARARATITTQVSTSTLPLPIGNPSHTAAQSQRRLPMQTTHPQSGARRGIFAGLAAVVLLVSLLALPPVRAAAEQFLQIFRVQGVVFVPISEERIAELQQLNFEGSTLFVGEPTLMNEPAEPRTVASASEASTIVGFPIAEPADLPGPALSTEYVVHDRAVMQFTVDVEAARQLFAMLNINVTLPDTLGEQPITADVSPSVAVRYTGADYELNLYQGVSPTVTLPDGVDLAQLGVAGLQLLGMTQEEAAALGSQIDWNNTLIFPFPSNIENFREVQIGAARGLLISGGEEEQHWQLYWQNGDRFAMLEGSGRLSDAEILAVAASVR